MGDAIVVLDVEIGAHKSNDHQQRRNDGADRLKTLHDGGCSISASLLHDRRR